MTKKSRTFTLVLLLAGTVLAACAPLGGGPAEQTVFVGPYLVDCVGVAPQKCMLIKEDPKDDWTLFYDQIEGFDYEEGFEYELVVQEEKVENPPADASDTKWTLVEVVSQDRTLEGTTWVLESYALRSAKTVDVLAGNPVTVRFQDGQLGGNASCNSYFGTYTVDGGRLNVSLGGATMMMCVPPALAVQEQAYLADLGSAEFYLVTGDQLRIADDSGKTVLTYGVLKPASLTGTLWELTGYDNGKGGFASVLTGTEITALFDDEGHLGGSAGCNNYSTTYEVDGGHISIGPVAATMMFCGEPEGVMDQESAYTAALESATSYAIEGEDLTMYNADGTKALSYTVRAPTSLTRTPWLLTGYNNGKGGFASALAGTEITAIFDEDGNVSGSAGCNSYSASYQVEGAPGEASGGISIGPAATTRMMCGEPEGIMEQENAYLAAMQSAATYEIQGDKLELRNAGGTRLAAYVEAAEDPGGAEAPSGPDDSAEAQAPAAAAAAGLSDEALKNMEYQNTWTQSGTAPLTDGEYREQAAPGSATETVVKLTEDVAYGQLDGQDAAAVILVTDPGGSGTFRDLAIVVEQDGQPVNVAITFLGDRVQVNTLAIENNQIVVDMITHGPDDPMCCPTQHVVRTYELRGEQLVQTSTQVVGPSSGAGSELTGVVWKWTKFLESNDDTLVVDDPDRYTIEFRPEGRVQIQADCNTVGGTYTANESRISIELGPSTLVACPADSLADEYLKNLIGVVSYIFDDGNLALSLRYDSGIMMFVQ